MTASAALDRLGAVRGRLTEALDLTDDMAYLQNLRLDLAGLIADVDFITACYQASQIDRQ